MKRKEEIKKVIVSFSEGMNRGEAMALSEGWKGWLKKEGWDIVDIKPQKTKEEIAQFYMLELVNAKTEGKAIEMLWKFMGV